MQRAVTDEPRRLLSSMALAGTMLAATAGAQVPERLDPIVVTATRADARAFDLPVAIDSIDAAQIQQGQLQLNLSESLGRVPGIVVQNRWNYAQDLMVSIAWIRLARQLRRTRRAALPGRHSGNHARWPGPDR